jgi:hypothetical protein
MREETGQLLTASYIKKKKKLGWGSRFVTCKMAHFLSFSFWLSHFQEPLTTIMDDGVSL